MCDMTNPAFTDETKAREFLEDSRWPDGAICPFCGQQGTVNPLGGKSMGPGWFFCSDCKDKFTVRTGTVMERSHIPLHKWLMATHLMMASKKGMSALQLQRMLGLGSYRSAWFMCHRLREALAPVKAGPIGGENKVVEADETFIGGKKKNRAFAKKEPKKQVVLSAVAQKGSQWLMISNCQESAAGMSRLTASAKAFNSASLYAGTRLQSMSQFAGGQILQRCIPLYPGKSKISVELNMCALN